MPCAVGLLCAAGGAGRSVLWPSASRRLPVELVRDCFAPSYRILKKNQGVWRLLTETMFPGYLFVASDDIEAFEKTIKRSTAFARLWAPSGALSRCGFEEASFVHDFGG
ncbi:MAG: hypothetical protein ACLTMP_07210 [Eggerthella lenta]